MNNPIEVDCPWCGEIFTTFFDNSTGSISYVEDCQICCRPIEMNYTLDFEGNVTVQTDRE